MNISREAADALHDHQIAATAALKKLEDAVWFATDLLLEADRLYRAYGVDHIPVDEAQQFVAGIRHYLLIAPALPPRPETPGGVDSGELSAPPGSDHVDIHVEDDISAAFADLTVTDDIDGKDAA